jgi:hypothetical protein
MITNSKLFLLITQFAFVFIIRAELPKQAFLSAPMAKIKTDTLVTRVQRSQVKLNSLPPFGNLIGNRYSFRTTDKKLVFLTLNPKLQQTAEGLIKLSRAPHTAIVAVNNKTGNC